MNSFVNSLNNSWINQILMNSKKKILRYDYEE